MKPVIDGTTYNTSTAFQVWKKRSVHKGLCQAVSLRPSAVKLTIPSVRQDHDIIQYRSKTLELLQRPKRGKAISFAKYTDSDFSHSPINY